MAQSNTIDMLHGPLLKKILVFAMPLAASSILQQLFNSTDVAVVGRFSSHQALAAVGSNGPIISILVNLFLGIAVGANVVLANYLGSRDAAGVLGAQSSLFHLYNNPHSQQPQSGNNSVRQPRRHNAA